MLIPNRTVMLPISKQSVSLSNWHGANKITHKITKNECNMKKVKLSDFIDYLEKQVGQPYLNNSERSKTAWGSNPPSPREVAYG